MGVRYSASESAQLIQAMNNNVQIANEITDRLSSGCAHLLATADSGDLEGAAYTAVKGLFSDIIIPSISKLQAAIDDIQAELSSYQAADAVISGFGDMDLDQLKELKTTYEQQLAAVEAQIKEKESFWNQLVDFFTLNIDSMVTETNTLYNAKSQIEASIANLDDKIQKLEYFVEEVSKYFTDSLEVLTTAIQGATQLERVIVDATGSYYTDGLDMAWVAQMQKVSIKTVANTPYKTLEERTIDKAVKDMKVSGNAETYYRNQLHEKLKNQPHDQWKKIISDYNAILKIKDGRNLLEIYNMSRDELEEMYSDIIDAYHRNETND